jgi:hypothetical protein
MTTAARTLLNDTVSRPEVDGERSTGFFVGEDTISNLIGPPWGPHTVRYAARGYQLPPTATNGATTAWHCRIDYSVSQQAYGIFLEVPDTQLDTWGSAIWLDHHGAGDAAYVSCWSTGAGIEVASFVNCTRNIISTIQVADCANSVLYIGLWEQDVVPNYGMFLAQESYAKAFIAQKRTSSPDGQPTIGIAEHGYDTWRFRGLNSGDIICESLPASAGTVKRNGQEVRSRGAYWTGAASQSVDAVFKLVVEDDSPLAYAAYLYVGPPGSETLSCCYRPGALDMQLNTIQNVQYLDGYTGSVSIRSNAGGTTIATFDPTVAANETGMWLVCNQGGTTTVRRVTLSSPSGGKCNLQVDEVVS